MTAMGIPQAAQMAISVTVTRADGTTEDLGIVAYEARDPRRTARYLAAKARGAVVPLAQFFSPPKDG